MDGKELAKKRMDNLLKALNREDPEWVPLKASNGGASLAYAGVTYWDVENDFEKFPEAMGKVYAELPADYSNGNSVLITARAYDILKGCPQNKISDDGISMQHIQKQHMTEDEYELVTKDPMGYIENVLLPRLYPFLFEGPIEEGARLLEQALENNMYCYRTGPQSKTNDYILNTYGVSSCSDGRLQCNTPGDVIFDNFRGFKGTLIDLRRHYPEMLALAEKLWDINYCNHFDGTSFNPVKFPGYMAHIPTYLNTKQYQELCFKYFKHQVEQIHAGNGRLYILAEGKWKHLWDFYKDLPKDSTIINVEDDDFIETYAQIGHHQIICGGARLTDTRLYPLEYNIEKAKKVIDFCAPDKGFIFGTDKSWCCRGDINDTLIGLFKFVRDYAKY